LFVVMCKTLIKQGKRVDSIIKYFLLADVTHREFREDAADLLVEKAEFCPVLSESFENDS